MIHFFLFALGACAGSFLNVVALRWDLPRRAWVNFGGRSACPQCSKTLRWFELFPIFSFLVQKGKCRSCGSVISWQYPLVEALTGLVFASLYFVSGFSAYYLVLAAVFSIYIVILVYDAKHKIIPDELVYTAIVLSLFYALVIGHWSLVDFLSGPIIFAFFASIWLISRGRAMGFGDAKLGLSVGLLLGAAQGFSAIILAFWLGAVFSLSVMALGKIGFLNESKGLTMKSEVPFAPFIILGAWLSLIFGLDILYVDFF